MSIKQLLVSALLKDVENVGETSLESVLQTMHDKEPTEYSETIDLWQKALKPLTKYVGSTEGKIDDGIVLFLTEAIAASAAKNGIQFTG